nr:GDYXXLXY domain-containing protein [Psychrobacter sp. PraFG1]UTT87693.1 GDYXXLXY domain-containing protein [Psychrobacter sp. PraFG1]
MFEIIDDIALSIAAFMLMQALLLTLFTDVLSRFFSSVMGLLALVWLLAYVQLPEASPAILALLAVLFGVHLQSVKQPLKGRKTLSPSLLNAMAYATSFVLLLISVVFIAAEYQDGLIGIGSDFQYRYALAQLLLTLSSLYAAYIILQRYQLKSISKTGGLIALAIGLLAVVSVYVSGVLASSLVIIIAMANQNRTLRGLGISALVGYIFWYYYQLDSSLLLKAGSMLAVAAALFMIRWAMRRLVGIPKSTEHLTQSHLPSQADAKSLIYANVPTYANVRTYANVPTTTRAWGTNLAAAILGLLLTLSVVNISIAKNEKLLATGESVLLKLAPVDPRSLMQGDYMALNYALSEQIIRALEAQLAAKTPIKRVDLRCTTYRKMAG